MYLTKMNCVAANIFAGTDETRENLHNIRLSKRNNITEIEATNGHRLMRMTTPTEDFSPDDFPVTVP